MTANSTDLLADIRAERRRLAREQETDPFLLLLGRMEEVHDAKSADYGESAHAYSNFRRAERLGISPFMGCLVRLSDKFERIVHLSKHPPRVKDESIRDTLLDLANYALIAIILYDEGCGERGTDSHGPARP